MLIFNIQFQTCNRTQCDCAGLKGVLGVQGVPGIPGQEGGPGDLGYDGN